MEPNWAEENLQTIRLLMERSALYRRALAPIMLFAGVLGTVAAGVGLGFHLDSLQSFGGLWLGTAVLAVAGAFLIARRQALKDREPFWSPPTRRVGQALLPPLISGLFIGLALMALDVNWMVDYPLALVWLLFYGCALHSAGFFMARGIKWFGLLFIAGTMVLALLVWFANWSPQPSTANLTMGFFFGVLHLAYGVYLYLTEKGKNAA